ncbi:effector-associated domain EAD1-containing protein [Sorangium sp. So ce385]|uniref:effector-associated domain EAD1-containing protein n=1 Tax=Sorangium sp. So ce385 TaxID=3133308 RepID=UPI003F5B0761
MTPPGAAKHFLDDFKYAHPEAVELRGLLAKAYRRAQDIEVLLEGAGLDLSYIDTDQAPIHVWQDALRQASDALRLRPLLDLVLADGSRKKYHDRIRELMEPAPIVEAPVVDAPGVRALAVPDSASGVLPPGLVAAQAPRIEQAT